MMTRLLGYLGLGWVRIALGVVLFGAVVGIKQAYDYKQFAAGAASVQQRWDASLAEAQRLAVDKFNQARDKDIKGRAILKKEHENEIAAIRTSITQSPKLRISKAVCRGTTDDRIQAGDPDRSAATDSGTVVLPEPLDRNLKLFILEVEQTAATARLCQRVLQGSGCFAP